MGLLLIVLPWSGFWEENYFGRAWPVLEPILKNAFVRGAVSGLGAVNIVAGFADLVAVLALRDPARARRSRTDRPTETQS